MTKGCFQGVMTSAKEITICALQRSQLQQVAQWQHRERAHYGRQGDLRDRVERLSLHLNGSHFPATYVAMDAGKPVASASLVYYGLSEEDKSLWLSNVFVLPDYRCQGLATRLINYCRDRAGAAGEASLQLFTADRGDFYRARGWRWSRTARVGGVDVDIFDILVDAE